MRRIMQIFSPNMLKTFFDCEKKYELKYIKKINIPQPSSVFEKGKKIHALAHYYLRGDNIDKLLPNLTENEFLIWQKLLKNEFFQKKYINSEYNLTSRIGEYWIGGRLDAFMKSDNNYYILDYKTGSIPKEPEYDFQTIIYLLCANKILTKGWGKNFNLSFVYIDLKNDKNHIVEFNNPKLDLYETAIQKACDKITNTQNFQQNKNKCKFCEYNKLCQAII